MDDGANLANDPTYDFIEQSYLTYLVPSRTSIDLDKAFKDVSTGNSILESIEQRESLFFGMKRPLPPLQKHLTNLPR